MKKVSVLWTQAFFYISRFILQNIIITPGSAPGIPWNLGDDANGMSNEKIQELIDHLSAMAKWALEESIRVHANDISGQN